MNIKRRRFVDAMLICRIPSPCPLRLAFLYFYFIFFVTLQYGAVHFSKKNKHSLHFGTLSLREICKQVLHCMIKYHGTAEVESEALEFKTSVRVSER